MNLNGKILLITGGSGLIGSEIIKNITEYGGTAINLDINCMNDLAQGSLVVDINDHKSISIAIEKIIKKYNRVDGLVYNAYPKTDDWEDSIENVTSESFNKNLNMQLGGVFSISKFILKVMKEQLSGSIVNIASIYGMVGNNFNIYEKTQINPPVAYSAIKGGLINYNKFIASYYGKFNIRSNCVSPGGIVNNQDSNFIKNYTNNVPMKRMGKPDDIAPLVTFLLSDSSKYITGQNIAIDGGWTAI